LTDTLALAGWRREIAALYARIRDADDPQDGWRDWCETRNRLFREHPASPIPAARRANYAGIPVFAYDPALRFACAIAPAAEPQSFTVEIGQDGTITMYAVGRTDGLTQRLGGELALYWIEGYGGGLFLPFCDATCGGETYGGGRYLLDAIKGADLGVDRGEASKGRLILDFNFAYHPSCAHAPDWVCPLAPPDNHLPNAVRGGERL
jgi:uncharacterized protein (DUF1684 family)